MSNEQVMARLEAAKKSTQKGGEYWMARDIQAILGYSRWENFRAAIERAVESCRNGGISVRDHFLGCKKMVKVGSGARVEIEDFYLHRYACYLIAMNGDTAKPEIAAAQSYFAVQTRLQELDRKELSDHDRVRLRGRLSEATKLLHSAAAGAGVQNYALFHNAGYVGLYAMGLRAVKLRKGIPKKEDLYDRAGRLELSANEFKANLTEQSILTKAIKGQQAAEQEHKRVGRVVRQTIVVEAGVNPEDLPAEPSIKAIAQKKRKALSQGSSPPNKDTTAR